MVERDYSALVMKDEWQAPYIGRKISDKFEELLGGNGSDLQIGEYSNYRMHIKASSKDGCLYEIDYYKIYDATMGHGRPVMHDVKLTPSDKSRFVKILNEATVPRAPVILDKILNTLQNGKDINGWCIIKTDKRKIYLRDQSGIENVIAVTHLNKAIEISHTYIEAIDSPEFYQANPGILDEAEVKVALALMSLIDVSEYYNYLELLQEKEQRFKEFKTLNGLRLLINAIKKNDTEAIIKHAEFAPFANSRNCETPLLITAVQNNNAEAVRALANAGVDVNVCIEIKEKRQIIRKTALLIALEQGKYNLIEILARSKMGKSIETIGFGDYEKKHRVDYELLLFLAKLGIPYYAPTNITKLCTLEELKELASYGCILWEAKHMQLVLEAGDLKTVKQMIRTSYMFDRIPWIISTNRIDLMKFVISEAPLKLKAFQLDTAIFDTLHRGDQWKKYVRECFESEEEYKKAIQGTYIQCVRNSDFEGMNILLNEYHDLPQYGVLYKAARETKQGILPSIQEFLLDHIEGQEKERANLAYHYGSLNMFYEIIIPSAPYELCAKLIQKYPELLKDKYCAERIRQYCKRREDNNVLILAEKMGLV